MIIVWSRWVSFTKHEKLNYTHTHTHWKTYWKTVEVAFISFNRKKTAATSDLTTEQKLTFTLCHWNDDWHSGAVRLEDASDTCTRIYTCTHLGSRPCTHNFIFHLHQLSYTYIAARAATVSLPLPSDVFSQRGEGSRVTLRFVFPAFCLSSQANSGTCGDITQRLQPYVSVVHRRSNMTPQQ